jgi:hypothetical protein
MFLCGQVTYPQLNAMRAFQIGFVVALVCLPPLSNLRGEVRHRTGSSPVSVSLASEGQGKLPIIVSAAATPAVRAAANELKRYLEKIAGAIFELREGTGREGIVVGTAKEFPSAMGESRWQEVTTEEREAYALRSHAEGVWVIGATDLGVSHAVWDLLYHLGHRQYFPGDHWEIVPFDRELTIAIDVEEAPDYLGRRIWYGFGPWDYAKEPYAQWCQRNRMGGSIDLHTGHAYDGFVKAAQQAFAQHPEYWPLQKGERKEVKNPKPCLGNPAVRKLFVEYALAQFAKNPNLDSVSMDPSDGGGWCECPECARLGSITDQAVTLANEVAEAINAQYSDKYVGIYAYNFHSSPPNIRVHPQVIVSAATAFIKGGQSIEDILDGWSQRGATLGIREYYSVNTWDRDQPAHARGGNIAYLTKTIPEFYSKGARFLSAESSDNWGPNGLGYYLASRIVWNTASADQAQSLIEDFLEKAFGEAKEPMREFYQQLDGSTTHLVLDDQLGRMFRSLDQARRLSRTPEVKARVEDLVLYARYCSLYHQYAVAEGTARQAAYESLIRHAYRMRTTMLVHTYALYRDLAGRDKTIALPEEAKWQNPESKNPWKSSAPFAVVEIDQFLREGIERHPLVELDFNPAAFSANLVPAANRLHLPELPAVELGAGRGQQTFFGYFDGNDEQLELVITGGLIAHYRDRGNVKTSVWKMGGASTTGEQETLIATDRSVPPDGQPHEVKIAIPEAGLYRIEIQDGQDRTEVRWPASQKITVPSTEALPMNKSYGQWMQYFYVPKGTKTLGFYGGEHGEIRDSQDRPHFWLNGRPPNFYSVTVPPGEDGKVWRVKYVRGNLQLLTVPSYFASTPQALLLPQEVVERDER